MEFLKRINTLPGAISGVWNYCGCWCWKISYLVVWYQWDLLRNGVLREFWLIVNYAFEECSYGHYQTGRGRAYASAAKTIAGSNRTQPKSVTCPCNTGISCCRKRDEHGLRVGRLMWTLDVSVLASSSLGLGFDGNKTRTIRGSDSWSRSQTFIGASCISIFSNGLGRGIWNGLFSV